MQNKRNPFLAAIFSLVAPGLGQIYAGDSNRGAAIIVGAVVVANLNILILPLISMANPTFPFLNLQERFGRIGCQESFMIFLLFGVWRIGCGR